jgi:hypothetical protein
MILYPIISTILLIISFILIARLKKIYDSEKIEDEKRAKEVDEWLESIPREKLRTKNY